jgi:tRNA A37 methylthiotransferase MiaB
MLSEKVSYKMVADSFEPENSKIASAQSFYIYTKTGCPRRSLESTKLYKYLTANNLRSVDNPKKADLIFIYTCGGFELDESFSLKTIEKSVKLKNAKVIVSGCLTKIYPEKLEPFNDILVLTPEGLEKLDSLINAKIPFAQIPNAPVVEGVHDLYHGSFLNRVKRNITSTENITRICSYYVNRRLAHKPGDGLDDPNIYRVEIAKGCLSNCTYCAIKMAMPKFHSFPIEEILENFEKGLSAGYTKFALLAGDIGCYGLDIGTNLPKLLKELFKVEGDYQLILVDLNARWFIKYSDELISVLKANQHRIHSIILPIQSGSNKILKLMNRQYQIEDAKRFIVELQKNIPALLIETHILVGFPGETEADFFESVKLIKEIKFWKVAVYQYQDRPKTISASLPDKVSQKIVEKRIKIFKNEIKNSLLINPSD